MTEPRCTGTKTCCRCNRELHVLAFSCDRSRADGVRSHCRDCESEAEALQAKRSAYPKPRIRYGVTL